MHTFRHSIKLTLLVIRKNVKMVGYLSMKGLNDGTRYQMETTLFQL